jgi:eukaryotic-like serine/threonine-protein kinase
VDDLVKAHPDHTIINSVLAPIARAGIALSRNSPAEAIECLGVVAPYELGFCAVLAPIYLRAQSQMIAGSTSEATHEFQRLLDHRGSEPFSPFCVLAEVGLARAHTLLGNIDAAVRSYERFLSSWSEADSDIPLLLEARQEYSRLKEKPIG